MTIDEAKNILRGKLIVVYGYSEGLRTADVILDPIFRDFRKMVRASEPSLVVSEEYNTEDRKASIVLTGCKSETGKVQVTDATCNLS